MNYGGPTGNSVSSFKGFKKLCNEGRLNEAVQILELRVRHRLPLSTTNFYYILLGCMNKEDLEAGRHVDCLIVRNGFESNTFLGSHLIRMFASCGGLLDATRVFFRLPEPSVFAWSAIISAYAKFGQGSRAIQLYHQMQQTNLKPDGHVFVAVLRACTLLGAIDQGKMIHSHMIDVDFELNEYIGSSLIDMYAKCGSIGDAFFVFSTLSQQDTVTWNAMIAGCAQNGLGLKAFQFFQLMLQQSLEPDKVTFVSILKACANIMSLDKGKLIHACIIESGVELDLSVSNSIIDMYAKCKNLDDACSVFERLPKQDVVTWGAIMAGCTQHRQGHSALRFFQHMQDEKVTEDRAIYLCILKACSSLASLYHGKEIHCWLIKIGLDSDLPVENTLIDMYAKCGSFEDACKVFASVSKEDVVTWNAIIEACAHSGNYNLALQYFEELQQKGLKPDKVTFISLLCACNHLGLVDEGCNHFNSMQVNYGISPSLDHNNCLVDLLGHTGYFNEAEDFLQTMPFKSDMVGWMSLLNHCRIHGIVQLGSRCFDHLISTDCRDAASYVLMSQIYTYAGRRSDADKVEELRNFANAWKKPGMASLDIDDRAHDLVFGVEGHPESYGVHAKLKRLSVHMEDEGYMPDLDLVLQLMLYEDMEASF